MPVHLAPYIPGNGPTTFDSPETQINSKTSSPIQKISEKEPDQSQSIGSEQTTPVNVEDFTEEEKNSSISGKSPERKRTESDNNSVTATLNEEPVKNEIPVREYPRAEVMQDPRLVPMQYPSNVVIGADGQSYIQSPVYNMNPVYMHPFIGSPVNNLIGNVMVPQMIPTQQGNFMIMDQQIQMQNNFAAQPLVTGPDEGQKVELEKENEFGISFIADLGK